MSSPVSLSLMMQLLAAISTVESNDNDAAVGDNGKARGRFQIHEEVVLDVNRIYGTNYHWLNMTDRTQAEWVAFLWLRHQSRRIETVYGGLTPSGHLWRLARIWNGGATGWPTEATEQYAYKIADLMQYRGQWPETHFKPEIKLPEAKGAVVFVVPSPKHFTIKLPSDAKSVTVDFGGK